MDKGLREEVSKGKCILAFSQLDSTQDVARKLLLSGAEDIVGIRTDYQSAGRGRPGARWEASPKSSLLVSYILDMRPYPAEHLKSLSLVAGAAVISCLEEMTGITPGYKWPNDILIANRKVGGILVEIPPSPHPLKLAIIGVGVNLTQKYFPVSIEQTATSLFKETHIIHSAQSLSITLYQHLIRWSDRLLNEGLEPILHLIRKHDGFTNKLYRAQHENGVGVGSAVGISNNGKLILRMEDGTMLETQNATSLESVHPEP